MFWIGLFVGMLCGVCCLALVSTNRRHQERVESLEGCENCLYYQKLEASRADCKALEEQVATLRKSKNALQGVVNQQLYTIKAMKREACLELGNQFFSKNVAR